MPGCRRETETRSILCPPFTRYMETKLHFEIIRHKGTKILLWHKKEKPAVLPFGKAAGRGSLAWGSRTRLGIPTFRPLKTHGTGERGFDRTGITNTDWHHRVDRNSIWGMPASSLIIYHETINITTILTKMKGSIIKFTSSKCPCTIKLNQMAVNSDFFK